MSVNFILPVYIFNCNSLVIHSWRENKVSLLIFWSFCILINVIIMELTSKDINPQGSSFHFKHKMAFLFMREWRVSLSMVLHSESFIIIYYNAALYCRGIFETEFLSFVFLSITKV